MEWVIGFIILYIIGVSNGAKSKKDNLSSGFVKKKDDGLEKALREIRLKDAEKKSLKLSNEVRAASAKLDASKSKPFRSYSELLEGAVSLEKSNEPENNEVHQSKSEVFRRIDDRIIKEREHARSVANGSQEVKVADFDKELSEIIAKAINNSNIKKIINERCVTKLIHFTRYENIESILNNGLVARDDLGGFNHEVYVNDDLRLDGHRNSISISISFPNHKMFYKYRMIAGAKGWVVLVIDPEVLWAYKCAFCKYNAADSRISKLSIADLSGFSSLREMFLEDSDSAGVRVNERLESSDPTDSQAEVLVFNKIDPKYILAVGFNDVNLLNEVRGKHTSSHVNFFMADKYYNSRGYVR